MATALQETKRIEKILSDGERLPRLLLLQGLESYYIDRIEHTVLDSYIPLEDRDTEQIILYGTDVTMSDIALQAQSVSLFANKRLVVVREANQLSDIDKLIALVPKIPSGTTLLVSYRDDLRKRRSAMMKKLDAFSPDQCTIVDSPTIKNNRDILSIITQSAAVHGTKIEENAKSLLVELVGYNGSTLDREISKLAIAAGSAPVTTKLVELLVGFSRQYSVYELRKAVVEKNRANALEIASVMAEDEKNYPLPRIVATLYEFFANLMSVHYIRPDARTPENIAETLGLRNKYDSDEYIKALSCYSPAHTFKIVNTLRMTDARYKGANSGDYRAESLLMNLMFTILE